MNKSEALQIIADKVSTCTLCAELAENRKLCNGKTVPGEGNPDAEILVLGEGPGKDEESTGRPFVGKAGKLLDKILQAAGFPREQVFVCNIVKCRPPNNREPMPEEANNCRKFLDLQIKCINPNWIICFGKTASVYLLGLDTDTTIGSLRGKIHNHQSRKVIATYHPSYALRQPSAKEEIWRDLQPIISVFGKKS